MISVTNKFQLIINTKNNTPNELLVKKLIEEIINQYNINFLTNNILIDETSIPHSHPILTINTKYLKFNNPKIWYLKLLIHENLHWYEEKYLTKSKYIHLENEYKNIFKDDKNIQIEMKNNLKSFILHIIVIYNEMNTLKDLLTNSDIKILYHNEKNVYYNMEKWIMKNFKNIENNLNKLNLIWKIK